MRSGMRFVAAATLFVAVVGVAIAQQPRQRTGGGFGGGPLALITNEAVQSDIKLSDEQKEKLKTWAKDMGTKIREKSQEKFKDIPKDEIREKAGAIMAELNKEVYAGLSEVLKPEQIGRIKQIALQQQALRAFENADVQKVLKLDDDQKAKIKSISEESSKERRELFEGVFTPGQRPDREKMEGIQKKSAALSKEAFEKTEKVLSDEQKATWKKLTGEPFDTTKLGFGGFGGGGFGGGNRPQPQPKNDNK